MITIFSGYPLYFLSRLKSWFENCWFQTSDPNLIKSKNIAFIKKTPQSSVLSYQCRILSSISEAALCLLLIAVTLHTSRDIYHPISIAINTNRGLRPRTHLYLQLPLFFVLLRLHKPCSGFLPPLSRSNQTLWLVRTIGASTRWKRSQRRTCQWANVSIVWGEIDILYSWQWISLTCL